MKKLAGFILTLGICIVIGAALFFTFTRLSSSTRDLILSKIPFFGKINSNSVLIKRVFIR